MQKGKNLLTYLVAIGRALRHNGTGNYTYSYCVHFVILQGLSTSTDADLANIGLSQLVGPQVSVIYTLLL